VLLTHQGPRSSQRARLKHQALSSDGGVEAVARHWVSARRENADWWEEAVADCDMSFLDRSVCFSDASGYPRNVDHG
jgi:hypothetical protein